MSEYIINYNKNEYGSGMITFTDIPNILSVQDSDYGTYATLNLVINTSFKDNTTSDGQWYITFLGETITNVLDPQNAVNKNFYVASTPISTAASIARAFRNCPSIAANFNIENTTYGIASAVKLTAKAVGTVWTNISNDYKTNISNDYVSVYAENGSADSDLVGALIDVDVYKNGDYITTLEKNWYGGEAAFDMSPVLTTFAEYGDAIPYTFIVSSIKDGEYSLLGEIDTNYISVGYMCNQGSKYLYNSGLNFAQNFSRGAERNVENNTLLYVYYPLVELSFYNGSSTSFNITIEYLDSAYNVIRTDSTIWRFNGKILNNLHLPLDDTYFNQAFYVDITVGTKKVRYNVIKPLKATEYSQRILWRNSYGGISFFDFTGQRSETRDVDISTYQKNIFGYYDAGKNELEKVYDNEVKYSVTLKSHLFEHDGKYIFNDLIQSAEVWTEINGQDYAIILDSVSVDETDNNNIYEATVKYRYSQSPSLI